MKSIFEPKDLSKVSSIQHGKHNEVIVRSLYARKMQKQLNKNFTVYDCGLVEHFKGIFHDFMFAYRKFHGCAAALLTLTEHWREELDKRKVIAAVAIDLSKAFDCLPHDLILEKLKFYGMNDNSVSLLQSF